MFAMNASSEPSRPSRGKHFYRRRPGLTLRVDTESLPQGDVALLPEARERYEVVRGDGGNGLPAIVRRRFEPAAGGALEVEDRAAGNVHVVNALAESFRHRAEILAHDETAIS